MKIIFDFVKFIFSFSILFVFSSLNHSAWAEAPQAMGAVTCSAVACHGGMQKKKNEFTLWSTVDKHRKAYSVLFDPRSAKMAKILGLKQAASEDDYCLSCHAVKAETPRHARYDIQEGVSCETCHGNSEKWLEPHTRKGWTHAQSVSLGMKDLKNIPLRTETCLNCHSTIDHRLLSAGHPDIVFEMDTFSTIMPKHWEENQPAAKIWAIGQAIALRNHLKLFQETTKQTGKLDEGFRNCFACHHNIYDIQWSLSDQGSGKAGWNHAKDAVFLAFLKTAFSEEFQGISPKIDALDKTFVDEKMDLDNVISKAKDIQSALNDLIPKINALNYDAGLLKKVILTMTENSSLAEKGYHTAEQTVMALESLAQSLGNPLKAEVKKLSRSLDIKDPARYNPKDFAKALENLHAVLSSQKPSEKKIVNPKGFWGKTN